MYGIIVVLIDNNWRVWYIHFFVNKYMASLYATYKEYYSFKYLYWCSLKEGLIVESNRYTDDYF